MTQGRRILESILSLVEIIKLEELGPLIRSEAVPQVVRLGPGVPLLIEGEEVLPADEHAQRVEHIDPWVRTKERNAGPVKVAELELLELNVKLELRRNPSDPREHVADLVDQLAGEELPDGIHCVMVTYALLGFGLNTVCGECQ